MYLTTLVKINPTDNEIEKGVETSDKPTQKQDSDCKGDKNETPSSFQSPCKVYIIQNKNK